MKRYLLFDSGCCQCSKLARTIEQEVSDKLTIRSLHDPEVKELLDRERPGWKWEPMLVEEKGEKVRVFAGGAMMRRLVWVLGPRRAWKILKLVAGDSVLKSTSPKNVGRRNFLRLAGAAAVSAITLMVPNISQADERSFPRSNINHAERFAFVPLRSVEQVNNHVKKLSIRMNTRR